MSMVGDSVEGMNDTAVSPGKVKHMPVASCDPKDDSVCIVCDSYTANPSLTPQAFPHLKQLV